MGGKEIIRSMENELKKFAFWNEALDGKQYNLEVTNKAVYEVHVEKCGVCGSSAPLVK